MTTEYNSKAKSRPVRLCIMTTVPITVVFFYGEQIDFLKNKGFDITVMTSPDNFLDKRISKSCRLVLIPMIRGISPFRDLIAFGKVFWEIKKGRFDIVQYCSPKAALLGSISAFILRVPVRLYLMWGLYYSGQQGFKRKGMKFVEKLICFFSTHIAPDSESNRDFAVNEGLCPVDKISVVGEGSANGIDLNKFNPQRLKPAGAEIRKKWNIPEKALVLGFAGRLRGDKGINELVYAFESLVKRYPYMYLLLVGPLEAELSGFKDEVSELIKTHKQIVSVGYQERVEEFMAVMDIFVLPSYREGFGVVNVEASAMGLPVVSTSINGARDSVINNQTGFLVLVKSVKGLLEKIEKLIKDEELRKKMGEAGKQWAKKFEQRSHWGKIFQHRLKLLSRTGYISYDNKQDKLFAEVKG